MNIENGSKIILRNEYVKWYNSKSDVKIIDSEVMVINNIEDDKFPYLVLDTNNKVHKIGSEDIDEKLTRKLGMRKYLMSFLK